MYSPQVILASLTYYNTDSTLKEASKKVNKRFGVKIYPQLISHWLREFKDITTYQRIRKETGPVDNVVLEHTLKHRQNEHAQYPVELNVF